MNGRWAGAPDVDFISIGQIVAEMGIRNSLKHTENGAPASVTVRRRLEFIDTDAAGMAHWLSSLRLVEVAESALHTSLGTDDLLGELPRVEVSITFHAPLRFNDLVDIALTVDSVGRTSLRYRFELSCGEELAASGTLSTCLIDRATGRSRVWPDQARLKLCAGGPRPPGKGR